MMNSLSAIVFVYKTLPRHKALKCHSKCRLELKEGGGRIKKTKNTLKNLNLLSPDTFPSILAI